MSKKLTKAKIASIKKRLAVMAKISDNNTFQEALDYIHQLEKANGKDK